MDGEEAQKLTARMKQWNIVSITKEMSTYPPVLLEIKSPPHFFYAMGNLALLEQSSLLGIVGPREMSPYAERVMEALFEQAKGVAFTSISGMARGVDQKCHQLSLTGGIPTIAILGGGLRRYLRTGAQTFIEKIVAGGGLVFSEFKLDFQPTKWSFPQRNRLIAGLSKVLFLPEAREGSGSLITVNYALQMKKEVFVAPNQLFSSNGKGSNQLLAEGKVRLLNDFSQLFAIFDKDLTKKQEILTPIIDLTEKEKEVMQLVRHYVGQDFSEWNSQSGWEFGELLSALTLLEMKGVVRQERPGWYKVK
ncbi:MAG: DNA-protecting protein DprA [Candidatus Peribacteria bacterium]|nr:DNA-protecting protein DprA [Candidatus Peribacteria bacterium]